MSRVDQIHVHLTDAFTPAHLEIIDDSEKHAGHAGAAGGGHFTVTIVSPKFTGKTPVTRHRMVYQAVADLMPAEIHALSINALSPKEYGSL